MRRVLTTILAAGLLAIAPPAHAAADPAPSTYTSLSPVRVLDTRTGGGPVGPGGVRTLDLSARVPTTATAVVLNVTGVEPTAATVVTVFPAGATRPTASNLNLVPGDIRANQVTVTLGANRSVSVHNLSGNVHIVADLAGYYGTGDGARFTALTPNRLLDTRQANAPLGPGASRVLDLTDRVPASATAVTFNLTVTNPTASTFVTAWPAGTNRPTASNVNVPIGDTRPNLVTVAVGASRQVSLYNNAGSADLVVDLTGFYTPEYGAHFLPLSPRRVLDTRIGFGGPASPIGPGQTLQLDLGSGIPTAVTGAVLNLTATEATEGTFVTAWPAFDPRPEGSTLNVAAGQTVPNAAAVAFGRLPAIELYNHNGSVHIVADLAGVFTVVGTPCGTDCVLAWGDNASRRLGTGEAVFLSSAPRPVATLSGIRALASGYSPNAYALRAGGTVMAWGDNSYGQLGNGWSDPNSGSAMPVPVRGLTGVTAIAAGDSAAYALRGDGTVWSWGVDMFGQLGTGVGGTNVPVQVTGLSDVIAISARINTAYALRADGTVWAWGYNGTGALGNGSAAEYSPVPVQVSGLTGVTTIAAGGHGGYALRTDGTVWAWGSNQSGRLGDGQPCGQDPCLSRVPVRVSALTDVTAIAGGEDNGYAVRFDGTVWSWGTADSGALGNGTDCDSAAEVCESRVPVQVSDLTDVTQLASFDFGGYALRGDGSLWSWGSGGNKALGNENAGWVATRPVPVVGVSEPSAVAGGWMSGYAIVPNLGG